VGQYVVGVHVGDNKLLCDGRFGTYTASQEIVDHNTQFQGMHACPDGMAMTGLHVANNLLACAPASQAIERFVDTGTIRSGMHACPEGAPVFAIHTGRNLLVCGTQGWRPGESIDAGTPRHGMHSCQEGQYVVGLHIGDNLLLCNNGFGTYTASQEVVVGGDPNTNAESHGMLACPEGMAVTGLHRAKNLVACAAVADAKPRFVDSQTARFGMHACPTGSPVSGLHVANNLLLCETKYHLKIASFTCDPAKIRSGESSKLTWKVDCNAPDCVVALSGGALSGDRSLEGSETVKPSVTTTYTLAARSGGATVTATKQVEVEVEQHGLSSLALFNCHTDKKRIHIWMRDVTINGTWSDQGALESQWSGSTCPVPPQAKVISFVDKHLFEVVAVDCAQNDPTNGDCRRWWTAALILGDKNGVQGHDTIN
jgi:hypothetical protein